MAKKAPAAARKAPATKSPAKPAKAVKSAPAAASGAKKVAAPVKPAVKEPAKAPAKAPVKPGAAAKPAAASAKPPAAATKPAVSKTAGTVKAAATAKAAVPSKPAGAVKAPAKPAAAPKPVAEVKSKKVPVKLDAAESPKKPAATLAQAPAGTVVGKGAAPAAAAAKPAPANQPPRPIKRPKAPPPVTQMPPGMGRLMDPKNPIRKPLIPSGPKAAAMRPLGAHGNEQAEPLKIEGKSPFNKRELERYRSMLIRKRAELVGDIHTMESEALRGQSGSLSNSPNHMAEQGSEAYDQALSLDLAAADRKLIREIDDALERIKDGTYGLCQMTGNPIKPDRLEELPWARYSIEAARELERQAMRS